MARARHVRGPHVELRPVVREERRVTAALFLLQDVNLALEKGARFAIREGGRTVGAGTVTEIVE